MPKTGTSWQPGQSGNPKGRPPKARVLTDILQRYGGQTWEVDGKRMAGRRVVGRMLWELAVCGQATDPAGNNLSADEMGRFDIWKFLFAQIDGPPRQDWSVDLDSEITVHVVHDDGLDGTPSPAS